MSQARSMFGCSPTDVPHVLFACRCLEEARAQRPITGHLVGLALRKDAWQRGSLGMSSCPISGAQPCGPFHRRRTALFAFWFGPFSTADTCGSARACRFRSGIVRSAEQLRALKSKQAAKMATGSAKSCMPSQWTWKDGGKTRTRVNSFWWTSRRARRGNIGWRRSKC